MDIAASRIVKGAAATLSWQGVDSDGEPANPGTVTVGVTRSDGTTVVASGTATGGTSTAPRTIALTASQTASCDLLTATWSVSGTVLATTLHEVVGGVYVDVATIRATDTSLASTTLYPSAKIIAQRAEVERMFESATGVAWVPRFSVKRYSGTGTTSLALDMPKLRRVAWVRVYTDGDTYTSFTADELAAIPANDAGIAVRTDGEWWEPGVNNIEIGWEHGYDAPPADLRKAAIIATRMALNATATGIPDRSQTFQMVDGGTIVFEANGVTGVKAIDSVLARYDHRVPGIA